MKIKQFNMDVMDAGFHGNSPQKTLTFTMTGDDDIVLKCQTGLRKVIGDLDAVSLEDAIQKAAKAMA